MLKSDGGKENTVRVMRTMIEIRTPYCETDTWTVSDNNSTDINDSGEDSS